MDRLIYTALVGDARRDGAADRDREQPRQCEHGRLPRRNASARSRCGCRATGFRRARQARKRCIGGRHDGRARSPRPAATSTSRCNGDALLAVQAEDGSEAYTRRGDLQVARAALLTTGDGHPVLGDGGPITLPPARFDPHRATTARSGSCPRAATPTSRSRSTGSSWSSPTGSHIAKGARRPVPGRRTAALCRPIPTRT